MDIFLFIMLILHLACISLFIAVLYLRLIGCDKPCFNAVLRASAVYGNFIAFVYFAIAFCVVGVLG